MKVDAQTKTAVSLRVDRVNKWFTAADGERTHVLSQVSFSAHGGEFLVVRGPNGCGKSTLMNLIAGLDEPSSGRILLNDGHPHRAAVGYLFQDYSGSLLPWLTLGQNATLPLKLRGVTRSRRREALMALSEESRVGPLPFSRYPFQCSGGQQQKACFLRSLLASADFLILDEPFASLDRESRERLLDKLQVIRLGRRALILLVLHDLDDAIFLADRIICLDGAPATMQDVVQVNLPWPREPSLRVHKEFLDIRTRVLESLGELHH